MAPEPEISRSGNSAASLSPERLEETAESFGGGVHLAGAHNPATGTVAVAAGFSHESARMRADVRAAALDALRRIPDHVTLHNTEDARELYLTDFMPNPPVAGTARVAGVGLLSRDRYLLPAEVVRIQEHESQVEPTMVGVVGDRSNGATGVADLLAHDVFTRWWSNPRTPLLRVSAHLPSVLPPGVAASASRLGLWVSAFLIPGPDFRLAVVGLGGDGGTIATAGGRTVRKAIREAFLRAVASRAQPWDTLPIADSLRRLTVWHREADYLAYLEGSAVDADPAVIDEPPLGGATGWAEIAVRRFGHEPILVVMQANGDPVKVVCPGAACYRPALPGTMLPCPVP